MSEAECGRGQRGWQETMARLGGALHDLCQPLTTLQCTLELAGMTGSAEACRQAIDAALLECARLAEAVGSMRQIVRAGMQEAAEEEEEMRHGR
jgi:hypothetical protein